MDHLNAGMRMVVYQRWHDNGSKWEEYTYVDGDLNGIYQMWYYDGSIANVCYYIN